MAKKPEHSVKVYRGSIRISLNGDKASALRGNIKKEAFEPFGFINDPGAHGTGLWVNPNCSVKQMRDCMEKLWSTSSAHKGQGQLDHVWSNFELIDLRSLFKSLSHNQHKSDALESFLNEYGIGEHK